MYGLPGMTAGLRRGQVSPPHPRGGFSALPNRHSQRSHSFCRAGLDFQLYLIRRNQGSFHGYLCGRVGFPALL